MKLVNKRKHLYWCFYFNEISNLFDVVFFYFCFNIIIDKFKME